MNKKAQELELRNIMQGMEEFATFISFQSTSLGMRILSVESVEQDRLRVESQQKADVLTFKQRKIPPADGHQTIQRSLAFQDRQMH